MHSRLVSYLRDNRDHIIEHWLTEICLPAPIASQAGDDTSGLVPYTFFIEAFDQIIDQIAAGPGAYQTNASSDMNHFIGITCDCKKNTFDGRVCLELHDSGLSAFMSVFSADWDTSHEFNQLDRDCIEEVIHHALSAYFGKEVKSCALRRRRPDCPFTLNK